jgi:hypothetical protein
MNRVKLLLAGALVVAALSVAASAQAQVNGLATNPPDPSMGRVWNSNTYNACDWQVDGHRVRLWYHTAAGGGWLQSAWAPSGGCTEPAHSTLLAWILGFRLCIEAEGCGPTTGLQTPRS